MIDAANAELSAKLEAVVRRVEELSEEVERLRERDRALPTRPPAAASAVSGPPEPPAPPEPPGVVGHLGRREIITGLVGAAVGAAGLAAASGSPAAAADGNNLVLGSSSNAASSPTGTSFLGTTIGYGIGATDNGFSGTVENGALFGHAKGSAFTSAVEAIAEASAWGVSVRNAGGYGVVIQSKGGTGLGMLHPDGNVFACQPAPSPTLQVQTGSLIQAPAALFASSGPTAVSISGPQVALVLEGQEHLYLTNSDGTVVPDPTTGTSAHNVGELLVDTNGAGARQANPNKGTLWFCTTDGTPGTWRKLAGPGTAGAFHVLPAPVRVYDSRPGTLPSQGPKTPLTTNAPRTIDVTSNSSSVPAGATAAVVNVLLVNAATGNGNFTVWANGAARPQANTMVWGGNAGRFCTLAVTALDVSAKVQVVASTTTDVVLDVVGYYR